ncbi:MAG: hypothetical protein V5A22_06965 [Salinivenus sp.]
MRLAPRTPFFVLPIVLGLVLPGCFSFLHSGGIDRTIEGPYDRVFRATVAELRARGFSMAEIDPEAGRIVTNRRTLPPAHTARPVETVEASLEREGPETTDIRLYFTFVDQVSEAPSRPPDDGDDDRVDDVLSAAFHRSFDAGVVYDEYLDAIAERMEARRSPDGS